MKKQLVIPKAPIPSKIDEKARVNLEKWILYFRELSPKIIIRLPEKDFFDLDYYKTQAKEEMDDDFCEIDNWPEYRQVAFILFYDSSLSGHKVEYLVNNTYIFCFYDLAFGLGYFEWDGSDEDPECKTYSIGSFSKEALSWEYIAKLIKKSLIKNENAVKAGP